MRSSSPRCISRIEMPISAARCTASATRSSDVAPTTTCRAVAGTPARRHSSTGLRPSTVSGVSPSTGRRRLPATPPPRPVGRPFGPPFAADLAALRAAECPGRSSFGGVGPLPSSPRRRWPPEPTTAPFLVPSLRIAPRRRELPAIRLHALQGPGGAVGAVLDGHPGGGEAVADLVRCGEVAGPAGGGPLPEQVVHQRGERTGGREDR